MTTRDFWNQFDDEQYEQPPDPNKQYICYPDTTTPVSKGLTHLMKKVMLSYKIPMVLNNTDIKEVNKKNDFGITALIISVMFKTKYNNNINVVKQLIDAGADLTIMQKSNVSAPYCVSALYCASYCFSYNIDNYEILELLIKSHQDLKNDLLTEIFVNIISYNYSKHKKKLLKLLIECGADKSFLTHALKTVIGNFYHGSVILKNESIELANEILKLGADINQKIDSKFNTLVYVLKYTKNQRDIAMIELLLNWGVNLKFKNLNKLIYKQTAPIICKNKIFSIIFKNYIHNKQVIMKIYKYLLNEEHMHYNMYTNNVKILSTLPEIQTEIYYYPNNINYLLKQHSYAAKMNWQFKSNKLLYLY